MKMKRKKLQDTSGSLTRERSLEDEEDLRKLEAELQLIVKQRLKLKFKHINRGVLVTSTGCD